MIRVCFFISGFDYSGAEIVLDKYICENTEIDPYFVILYDNKKVIDKYISLYGKQRVFLLNLKHNKNILRFLPFIDIIKISCKADKIIKNIRPQVLYMNNTHEMMLCQLIARSSSVKSIAHIHDMRASIGSPIKRIFMDKSLNVYDEIITVSESTKKAWMKDNIKVIYNGIEESLFTEYINPDEKIKTIGFVGKISMRKGIDILEEAFSILSNDIHDLKLNIAYSSVDENCKDIFKKLESNKNISLFNGLNQKELIKFYNDIDLLVVTSRQDPLPTVIIEGMSQGTLVIGNNIDGIPELLGEEILLIEECNADKLCEKILQMINLDSQERNRYRELLLSRCNDKFKHSNKVNSINTIISNLIKN